MNSYQVKKKSSLPPWVQENLTAAISLGGIFLFVLLFAVFKLLIAPPEETAPILQADLVIVMGPVKTWEEGSATRIKSVQVKIKNRGRVPADGVVVTGVFRGIPMQLTGKTHLAIGEIADYSVNLTMVVLNSDSMEFKAECPNCVPYSPSTR